MTVDGFFPTSFITFRSQIIGPALFGVTFVNTVSVFPAAIFVLSAVATLVALVFFAFVRIPKNVTADPEERISRADGLPPGRPRVDRERTLVEAADESTSLLNRGRKGSKD